MSDYMLYVGIIAGIVQIIGYAVYYRMAVRGEISPNPLTWLMFAYGTGILTILEWDKGATASELFLPLTCSVCGIGIAVLIWKDALKERLTSDKDVLWWKFWPKSWRFEKGWDGYSFLADLTLTAGYVFAWALTLVSWLDEDHRALAALGFLVISNLTTFPGFVPIIRQSWKDPRSEHPLPWFIWTIAYGLLFLVTYQVQETSWPATWDVRTWSIEFWTWATLLLYPASNALMHCLVAILAARTPVPIIVFKSARPKPKPLALTHMRLILHNPVPGE